jgi:hypothetical protein
MLAPNSVRSPSGCTRYMVALYVVVIATLTVACGGGGGGGDGGGGPSGSASGKLYFTEADTANTLNVATGERSRVANLSIKSVYQLGYGGGMFTDVEVSGVEPIEVKVNLREVAPNPYTGTSHAVKHRGGGRWIPLEPVSR